MDEFYKDPEDLEKFLEKLTHEQEKQFWRLRVTGSLLGQVKEREDPQYYIDLGIDPFMAPAISAEWVYVRGCLEDLMEAISVGSKEYLKRHPDAVPSPYELPSYVWTKLNGKIMTADEKEPPFRDTDIFKTLFGFVIGLFLTPNFNYEDEMAQYEEEWRQSIQNESDYNNWLQQFDAPNPIDEKGDEHD